MSIMFRCPECGHISEVRDSMPKKRKAFRICPDMQIGPLVNTVLRQILIQGKIPIQEVRKLNSDKYCRETFNISKAVLVSAAKFQDGSAKLVFGSRGYYRTPVIVYKKPYFLLGSWKGSSRELLEDWMLEFVPSLENLSDPDQSFVPAESETIKERRLVDDLDVFE